MTIEIKIEQLKEAAGKASKLVESYHDDDHVDTEDAIDELAELITLIRTLP